MAPLLDLKSQQRVTFFIPRARGSYFTFWGHPICLQKPSEQVLTLRTVPTTDFLLSSPEDNWAEYPKSATSIISSSKPYLF